jgi:hypothetical protein
MSISFPGRSGCEFCIQARSVMGNMVTVTEFLMYIEPLISPITE